MTIQTTAMVHACMRRRGGVNVSKMHAFLHGLALQLTAAGRRICNWRASWPPSLSLGRWDQPSDFMPPASLRAMQVLGAIGIESYCTRNGIKDPEVYSFIRHLWKIVDVSDLPAWSGECTRLCDRLIARLAAEGQGHLRHLCNAGYEITASQMYTIYRPERVARDLHDVSDLSKCDLESLAASDLFCRHDRGSSGWGEPVPESLVYEWKELAQQIAAANRDSASSSAARFTLFGPAWLSSSR